MLIISRSKYIQFERCNDIPIFLSVEWLDSVAGDSWQPMVFEEKEVVLAIFPVLPIKKLFFNTLLMPLQTQYLGPYYAKEVKGAINREYYNLTRKINSEIAEFLMSKDYVNIRLNIEIRNVQEFMWKDIRVETMYTYELRGIRNLDRIWSSLSKNVRRNIVKAEKSLKVVKSNDLNSAYDLFVKTFSRQGMKAKFSFEFFESIYNATLKTNANELLFAVDEHGHYHGALFLIIDKERAYYLLSGADPEFRSSQSQTLLIWHAIKESSGIVDIFDFEGSMIPDIAEYYRRFNASIVPYYRLRYSSNILIKIVQYLR